MNGAMPDRIDAARARALLASAPTSQLMAMADSRRRRLHDRRTFHVHSHNLNPTNICENRCRFCAFRRDRGDDEAYIVTLEAARQDLLRARGWGLTDLHVVGGIIPELDLAYYEALLRLAKELLPDVLVQGMTAVEIHWLATRSGLPVRSVLERLKEAGLGALSGGGAEIFAEDVRRTICPDKISAEAWLGVHEEAHALGIPTNATMLFGHVEGDADIVDHLDRLRSLQDRTAGFQAFIPLPFQADGSELGIKRGPTGDRVARVTALARVYLDNVPHIRALVNYMDRKLLGALMHGGVDDIGGTSLNERIAKAAGAPERYRFLAAEEMTDFIRRLGLEPVLTNSAYEGVVAMPPAPGMPGRWSAALARAEDGKRVSGDEAVLLHDDAPMAELGRVADLRRRQRVPGDRATFVVDRNLNVTNVCVAGCRFCAFHVKPGSDRAFALSADEVVAKVRESAAAGATQILLQGGLNPELDIVYYERLFERIRDEVDIWVHSLSPTEVLYLATRAGVTVRETLERLKRAGLQSLPGGGAEILVDEVRQRVSPNKISADDWFEVMRTAHGLGLKTTATMVYGLGETSAQRVEHLLRVRELQDETGGFTAFIPWSFQSPRTGLEMAPQSGADYLRIVALARIVLDNVPHIQAGWVTEGPDVAQLALAFGADDFGGVLMEEQVVRSTGVSYAVTRAQVVDLIAAAGWIPAQRTTQYEVVWTGERA
jgi:dehypoxanthine futalosine cyclase